MKELENRHFPYNAKIPSEEKIRELTKHVVIPSVADIDKHMSSLQRGFARRPVLGEEDTIEIEGVSIPPDELGRYVPSIDEKRRLGMSFTVEKKRGVAPSEERRET